MAKRRSRQRDREIQSIRQSIFGILLFWGIAVIGALFVLASGQNPKHWQDTEIVIQDISIQRQFKGSYYQITDETGATYSIHYSCTGAEKLAAGNHYQITYATIHHNRIQSMTDPHCVYVDYDDSLRDYYARMALGWSLLLGSSGVFLREISRCRRRIRQLQGTECST